MRKPRLNPRIPQGIVILGILLFPMSATPDQTAAIIQRVKSSVVVVKSFQTDGTTLRATGFIWLDAAHVITALHVVAGSNRIVVYSESEQDERSATIERVFRKADLALLRLDALLNTGPLARSQRAPEIHEQLFVLGYPAEIPSLRSTPLQIAYGGNTLRDLLPSRHLQQITATGYPDPNVEIYHLSNVITYGHSGAPVFNNSGEVVGIADGGLEEGVKNLNWAIPIHYASNLESSTESVLVASSNVHTLFASSTGSQPVEEVVFALPGSMNIELRKVKTRSLDQIAATMDDPLNLQQLILQYSYLNMDDPYSLQFDVYQHSASGATVVVPAGVELEQAGDYLYAEIAAGDIELLLNLRQTGSLFEAQQFSVEFENFVAENTPWFWDVDPNWTYAMPMTREDGLTIRRKAFIGYDPYTMMPGGYAMENFAVRSNVFLGYLTINNRYAMMDPYFARSWIHAVLSVFMTTFI